MRDRCGHRGPAARSARIRDRVRYENKDLFTFIPWDKSEAFKAGPEYSIWHNTTDVLGSRRNRLTARILEYKDLRGLFLDTLVACARSLGEVDPTTPTDGRGWMEREIEKEYAQIKDWATVSDEDRQHHNQEVFEREVENLRTFARRRPEFIREEVARSLDR